MVSAPPNPPEEVLARFEELSVLEADFEDAELKLIRESNKLNAPLWAKRAEVVAKIPHFWTLVFEQAPIELDNFIQPSDHALFADCLETLIISRFELDTPGGSPRSVSLQFGFAENKYFEDRVLEKKFWFRKSKDWAGLVSEPVKIRWKKGQDLTAGLTDAAFELEQARRKLRAGASANGSASAIAKEEANLPEHRTLVKTIEESNEASASFFTWFGFVSSYRWISAEESTRAEKDDERRLEKLRKGDATIEIDDDDDADEPVDFQEVEVFPQGDEIATLIAEDLWPSAIKYYKQSHEADDEDLSEIDEDIDDDEDDEEDEVDIRGLVGKGEPPAKRQRQA